MTTVSTTALLVKPNLYRECAIHERQHPKYDKYVAIK